MSFGYRDFSDAEIRAAIVGEGFRKDSDKAADLMAAGILGKLRDYYAGTRDEAEASLMLSEGLVDNLALGIHRDVYLKLCVELGIPIKPAEDGLPQLLYVDGSNQKKPFQGLIERTVLPVEGFIGHVVLKALPADTI